MVGTALSYRMIRSILQPGLRMTSISRWSLRLEIVGQARTLLTRMQRLPGSLVWPPELKRVVSPAFRRGELQKKYGLATRIRTTTTMLRPLQRPAPAENSIPIPQNLARQL